MCANDLYHKELRKEDYAYLAGIIDVLGSISIGKYKSKNNSIHYNTTICIATVNDKLAQFLSKKFGGGFYVHSSDKVFKKFKITFHRHYCKWTIRSSVLLHLCEGILPYMTLRKQEIEVMTAMRKTYRTSKEDVANISEEISFLREQYYKELKLLNHESGRTKKTKKI